MKFDSIFDNHENVREASFAIDCFNPIELELEPPDTTNCEAPQLSNTFLISKPDSKIKVYVVPTNEELVIARDTCRLLGL